MRGSNMSQGDVVLVDTFADFLCGHVPPAGLQILKLAMQSLIKEQYQVKCTSSKSDISQLFEFAHDLSSSMQRVNVKIQLTVEPSVCQDVKYGGDDLIQSDTRALYSPQFFLTEPSDYLDLSPLPFGTLLSSSNSQCSSSNIYDSCDDFRRLLATYATPPEYSVASSTSSEGSVSPESSAWSRMKISRDDLLSNSGWLGLSSLTLNQSNSSKELEHTSGNTNVTEVYVDGLPFEATHDDILKLFNLAGEVVNITIVKSGCAFILFSNPESAQRAIAAFNLKVMPGFEKIRKPMRVSESRRQEDLSSLVGKLLHVMNVPAQTTRNELFNYFSQCGPVVSVRLPPVRNSTSNNKGYGFVTYSKAECAKLALQMLSGKKLPGYDFEAKPLMLDYAKGCKPIEA